MSPLSPCHFCVPLLADFYGEMSNPLEGHLERPPFQDMLVQCVEDFHCGLLDSFWIGRGFLEICEAAEVRFDICGRMLGGLEQGCGAHK